MQSIVLPWAETGLGFLSEGANERFVAESRRKGGEGTHSAVLSMLAPSSGSVEAFSIPAHAAPRARGSFPLLPPKLSRFPRATSPPAGPRPPPAAPRPVLTARCRRLTPPSRGRPEEGGRGGERPAGPRRPAGCPRERCRPRCAAAAAGAGSGRSSGGSGQPRAAGAERGRCCACANGAAPAHGAGGAGSRPCLGFGFVRFLCLWVLIMSHTWSVRPEETKGVASALLTTSARGAAPISSLSWPVTGPEGMP